MPCVERTSEFSQIAERLRAQSQAVKPVPPVQPCAKSTFSSQSAEVRKYLNATTSKLERLAQLAASKSLFDDPTQEIEQLSFVVKDDIKMLQSRVTELHRSIEAKKSGTADNDQVTQHSKAVVSGMRAQLALTTNGFKEVLQSRADNIKTQHDRRGAFTEGRSTFGQALAAAPSPMKGNATNMFANPYESGGANKPLLGRGNFMMGGTGDEEEDDDNCAINIASLEQMQMVPQNSYGESRAIAVENIQKTMLELSEVYQQLNHMVEAQREMVMSIDEHTTDTLENVEAAQDMWSNYLDQLSGNRMLVVKIFAILLFFGLFFIVFLK